MSKSLPETITVTFTESDRQTAGRYSDICGCLMFTALRRMGFRVVAVGGNHAEVLSDSTTERYEFTDFCPGDIREYGATEKPFYKESVVGMAVTIRKEEQS